ncbi:MAG TPA: hypothetical protein EYM93_07660 [Methylococcales bacterium]|nr:hypothetical protein [Methylococcales bacterium]
MGPETSSASDQNVFEQQKKSIEKMGEIMRTDQAQEALNKLGLEYLLTQWRDTGRAEESCFGSNITDVFFAILESSVKDAAIYDPEYMRQLPILTPKRYEDVGAHSHTNKVKIFVKPIDGEARTVTVHDFLKNIVDYIPDIVVERDIGLSSREANTPIMVQPKIHLIPDVDVKGCEINQYVQDYEKYGNLHILIMPNGELGYATSVEGILALMVSQDINCGILKSINVAPERTDDEQMTSRSCPISKRTRGDVIGKNSSYMTLSIPIEREKMVCRGGGDSSDEEPGFSASQVATGSIVGVATNSHYPPLWHILKYSTDPGECPRLEVHQTILWDVLSTDKLPVQKLKKIAENLGDFVRRLAVGEWGSSVESVSAVVMGEETVSITIIERNKVRDAYFYNNLIPGRVVRVPCVAEKSQETMAEVVSALMGLLTQAAYSVTFESLICSPFDQYRLGRCVLC